jgi:hypothetical protein
VAPLSLGVQLLEDLHLVRLGCHFDSEIDPGGLTLPFLPLQDLVQAFPIRLRVIRLKFGFGPVLVKHGTETTHDSRVVPLAGADIPLQPVDERRPGEIGGADVGGGEPLGPAEEPGLGVESGLVGLVGDLDAGPESGELVQGPALGGAGVHRREHPEFAPSAQKCSERVPDHQEPRPTDEGAQEIDPMRARQLAGNGSTDPVVAMAVDQEHARSEGDDGALRRPALPQVSARLHQIEEELSRFENPVALGHRVTRGALFQNQEQPVGQGHLPGYLLAAIAG